MRTNAIIHFLKLNLYKVATSDVKISSKDQCIQTFHFYDTPESSGTIKIPIQGPNFIDLIKISLHLRTSMRRTARPLASFIYDDTTATSTEARSFLRLS